MNLSLISSSKKQNNQSGWLQNEMALLLQRMTEKPSTVEQANVLNENDLNRLIAEESKCEKTLIRKDSRKADRQWSVT